MTSAEQLRARIEVLAGVRGSKQAARAARYVLDNSWSPKESQIAVLLTLPRRMGGFGIEAPLLNYEMTPSPEARRVLKNGKIIPDMYWPSARVALEYDSDEHHCTHGNIEHDARKRSAYELMNIDLVSITYDQLRDFLAFALIAEHLADLLAVRAGKRRLPTSQQQRSKQLRVHNRLLYQPSSSDKNF